MNKEKNKIAPLENDFHKEQLLRQRVEKEDLHRRNRRLLAVVIIGLIGISYAFTRIVHDGKELQQLRQEEQVAVEKSQKLSEEEAQLKEDVLLLNNDDYLAKLARSRYLLTLDGETVYNFPKEDVNNEKKEQPTISVEKEK